MTGDFDKPLDDSVWPFTALASDGETTLFRYHVDAILYAPDRATAERRIREANIYFDAAALSKEQHG